MDGFQSGCTSSGTMKREPTFMDPILFNHARVPLSTCQSLDPLYKLTTAITSNHMRIWVDGLNQTKNE
jgi:hypothetical protein